MARLSLRHSCLFTNIFLLLGRRIWALGRPLIKETAIVNAFSIVYIIHHLEQPSNLHLASLLFFLNLKNRTRNVQMLTIIIIDNNASSKVAVRMNRTSTQWSSLTPKMKVIWLEQWKQSGLTLFPLYFVSKTIEASFKTWIQHREPYSRQLSSYLKRTTRIGSAFLLLEHVDYLIFLCIWYTLYVVKTATVYFRL